MKHNIDSDEEKWFSWWLDELIEAGYVIDYTDAKTYTLSEKLEISYIEQKKTKATVKTQSLVLPHVYTPDFEIKWHVSALNIFINSKVTTDVLQKKLDKNLFIKFGDAMLVETKGGYSKFGGLKENAINRKWLYDKYGLYVNLVKIPDLFKDTFTPKKFLLTPTGKQRLIHFKVKSLEEYVNEKLNEQ